MKHPRHYWWFWISGQSVCAQRVYMHVYGCVYKVHWKKYGRKVVFSLGSIWSTDRFFFFFKLFARGCMLSTQREGESTSNGVWSCWNPFSISPCGWDSGHAGTCAWHVFQAPGARIQTLWSAMSDVAPLTTRP